MSGISGALEINKVSSGNDGTGKIRNVIYFYNWTHQIDFEYSKDKQYFWFQDPILVFAICILDKQEMNEW